MSHKTYKILIFIVAFLVVTGIIALSTAAVIDALRVRPEPPSADRYDLGAKAQFIKVASPLPGEFLKNPITITGEARTWYFEASFPVEVQDATGAVLGFGIAQAQGDWMTDAFVPFKAEVRFVEPTTATGSLVLRKDNPSGLPEHDDLVILPIQFDLSKK